MVKIEAPHKKIFNSNTNTFTSDFNQAYGQLEEWYTWTRSNGNRQVLTEKLEHLYNTSSNMSKINEINFILIYGRRAELTSANQIFRDSKNREPFKVMTFDRLAHSMGDLVVLKPHHDTFKIIQITEDHELSEPLHGHFRNGA